MSITIQRSLIISVAVLVASHCVSATTAPPTLATVQQKLAAMSVPFVPNAGQWDARAAFAAQTFAGTLFVTQQGELVYSLPGKKINADSAAQGPNVGANLAAQARTVGANLAAQARTVGADLAALPGAPPSDAKSSPTAASHAKSSPTLRSGGWVLRETLVDAKGNPRSMRHSTLPTPAGFMPMEGKVSYAIGGDPSKYADQLNTYERVNLGDMYPGVNVQLRAARTSAGNNIEKIFTVAPKHDPKQIRIQLAGAQKLEINAQGELIAHTGNGPVAFTAPIAFQENDRGERVSVAVAYALTSVGADSAPQARTVGADSAAQRQVVGADLAALPGTPPSDAPSSPTPASNTQSSPTTYTFTVGHYDSTRPLVIDPLLASTYHGGAASDLALAIAIHPWTGDVYVAGETESNPFPDTTSGAQTLYGGSGDGGGDAFVTRFNAALTSRLQSSYLGGSADDSATALAIHPASGEVYVAGLTTSANFPGAPGGAQTGSGGDIDGFVTRLNAALTSRLQSSYLGGSANDSATALAIHPASGEVYVVGNTGSANFPGRLGGAQPVFGGGVGTGDAFVTRLNAALTSLLQSSYLGGTSPDSAKALAIHPASGEVYVAGRTFSGDFPGVAGGAQAVLGVTGSSSGDAFVTRFNAALTSLQQSSYLGGNSSDSAAALAIHPASGEVYVAGLTSSSDLPGSSSGAQTSFGGGTDAFISRFSLDLMADPALLDRFSFLHQSNVPPNTLRTSNEVRIKFTPVPASANQTAYVSGAPGSEFCFSDQPGVCTPIVGACSGSCFTEGWGTSTSQLRSNDYVTVRHTSATPSGTAETLLIINGTAHPFRSSTGNANIACNLDLNGDNTLHATREGLIFVRAMLGFNSAATVTGTGVTQANWDAMRPRINANCGTNF